MSDFRTDFSVWNETDDAVGSPSRDKSLQIRYRTSNTGPWSAWSPRLTVPLVTTPPATTLPAPSTIQQNIVTSVPTTMGFDAGQGNGGSDNGYNGFEANSGRVSGALLTYQMMRGVTSQGGVNLATRMNGIVDNWASGMIPSGVSAYNSQFSYIYVAMVAMLRMIPSFWNALTTQERDALTIGMLAEAYGAMWESADSGPGENSSYGSMRGYRVSHNNLNFFGGARLIPFVVANFMGVADMQTRANNFTRAGFASEILDVFPNAASYTGSPIVYRRADLTSTNVTLRNQAIAANTANKIDAYETFRRTWTDTVGGVFRPAPTATQLQNLIANPLGWRNVRGSTLANPAATVQHLLEFAFNGTIRPGLDKRDFNVTSMLNSWPVPPAGTTLPDIGVWNNNPGTQYMGGRMANTAAISGLPGSGLIGQPQEFSGTDASNPASVWPNSPGPRSALDYVHGGTRPTLILTLVLQLQGAIDLSESRYDEAFTRGQRGLAQLRYILNNGGYRSYSKGGLGTNNNLVQWSTLGGTSGEIACLYDIFDDLLLAFR